MSTASFVRAIPRRISMTKIAPIENGSHVQYCQFHIQEMIMGIPTTMVLEVLRSRTITPVPQAPHTIPGLFNLRGQIITTVDVRRCLELPDRAAETAPMHLLVQYGETSISLLIDKIGEVIDICETDIQALPQQLRGVAREYLVGAYQDGDSLVMILVVESMINDRAVFSV
jgi:purine-binding chemotaxis protein CheW